MSLEYSRKRLREYLRLIPEHRREMWSATVDELAFMEAKLGETRDSLRDAALTVDGGLIPHKNAAFDAYNALFDRYLRGLQALDAAIQSGQPAAGSDEAPRIKPKRGLDSFRRSR